MAKKGKSFLTLAAVSALAAGAYYLYKKNSTEIAVDMDDDDDIEGFSDDEDIDDKAAKRSYVSLDFNTVETKVKEAVNKAADVAESAASSLGDIIKKGEARVEEFFDDRKQATEVVGVDDLTDDDEVESTSETTEDIMSEEVTEEAEKTEE